MEIPCVEYSTYSSSPISLILETRCGISLLPLGGDMNFLYNMLVHCPLSFRCRFSPESSAPLRSNCLIAIGQDQNLQNKVWRNSAVAVRLPLMVHNCAAPFLKFAISSWFFTILIWAARFLPPQSAEERSERRLHTIL